MDIIDAKQKLKLRLDTMTQEQYEAVKKCVTKGAGLLLTEGADERMQILVNLQDALELLFKDCQEAGIDFEKLIMEWKGGDWETTIACFILQGNLTEIRSIADSI